MTRYIVSFDDVTNRFKRLSNSYYSTNDQIFYFKDRLYLGSDAVSNGENAYAVTAQNNNGSVFSVQCFSDTIYPILNIERRRANGVRVDPGNNLGAIVWHLKTQVGYQPATQIYSEYQGNGSTYLTDLTFKVSNTNAIKINSDLGFSIYNSSGNFVKLKCPSSFSNYTLTFPVNDGSAGQVLTTDGSGNLTWENKVNVDINDYHFETDNTGATNFDITIPLTSQRIVVTENGVLKREGALYDWTRSGTEIIFNYLVKNSWICATIYSDVSLTDFHYDVGSGGQTAFDTTVSLTGKRVLVYQNGVLKRQGASFDYTIAGTVVTMNYSVVNSWVLIFVYT